MTWYVAAFGRARLDVLKAYNYDWFIRASGELAVDSGLLRAGIVLEVDGDLSRAAYQSDRYASALFPSQVFDTLAAAVAFVEDAGIPLTRHQPSEPSAEDIAPRLTAVDTGLTEAVEAFLGSLSRKHEALLCECDEGRGGPCAVHALMDEVDRVQGRRSRRAA